MQLWPVLLGLAILLNLVELILRKWKGVLDVLGLRRNVSKITDVPAAPVLP